jgi:anaerobic ribonucleoside-triphosphate reductase activating protein
MDTQIFNIGKMIESSEIYGPGRRFVIWLQGCSLACKGCWNQQFWSFEPKLQIHRDQLWSRIKSVPNLTGVTLLGGEPLQQLENTIWLLNQIKNDDILDSFLYTGYEYHELLADPLKNEVLSIVDLLVLGRYQSQLRNTFLRWRGSSNQMIMSPTQKYKDLEVTEQQEVEIHIDTWGKQTILGYPNKQLLDHLLKSHT